MDIVKDKDCHGIEIFLNDIELLEREYIETLPDQTMIYKSNCFTGLLLKIYQSVLINVIPATYKNDYTLLNSIFMKVYLPLCYKYNINPTVIQFCSVLVNIDNTNISDIKNGRFRNGYAVKDVNATQTVKSWYSICESGLVSRAIADNSIGAIFSLKAAYSWNENPTPTIETKQDNDIVDISFLSNDQDKNAVPVLRPVD